MKHNKLPHPTNGKSLALYLLLERGKRGINVKEAIEDSLFYKLSARIWDLMNDDNILVYTKREDFVNRFGHRGATTRYFLHRSDLVENIAKYHKLNKAK